MLLSETAHNGARRAGDRTAGRRQLADAIKNIVLVGALIWGAARISATVDELSAAVSELKTTTGNFRQALVDASLKIARLEVEVEVLRQAK